MTNLTKAIINTLTYSDIFNYPLTIEEIHYFLTGGKKTSKKKIKNELKKIKCIEKKDNLYFFKGKQELVPTRKMRTEETKEKLKNAKKTLSFIGKIPTVKMLAISGSIAANNAKSSDDIDIFIITKKNKLWTTRFLVVLTLIALCKKRPKQVRTAKNKICPNMFLAEDSLKTLCKDQNIYAAREIAQLKVLVNKQHTYEKYLTKNSWIESFLPNIKTKTKKTHITQETESHTNFIEKICYKTQKLKMQRSRTNERIEKKRAHFHPNRTDAHILYLYKQTSTFYTQMEQKMIDSSTEKGSRKKKYSITPGS